jgi:Stage II sporulation protein E (SpoIIE)
VALEVVGRQVDPTAGNSWGTLTRSRATTAWAGLSWTSAWNRSRRWRTVRLQPGDGVVLYTDGITEAENLAREQYGSARLCTVVIQHGTAPAETIKERVVTDVHRYMGAQKMYDDITLVVMKRR